MAKAIRSDEGDEFYQKTNLLEATCLLLRARIRFFPSLPLDERGLERGGGGRIERTGGTKKALEVGFGEA